MALADFFAQLKTLIDGDVKIDFSRFFNINIKTQNITINLEGATAEQLKAAKQKITPLIKQGLQASPDYLLETPDSGKKLTEINEIHTNPSFQDLISFVYKALPSSDHGLWVAGLMIRKYHEDHNKDKVTELKNQLSQSAGQKGRNIANICTAGYLESHIIPLYTHLVEAEGEKEMFLELYRVIVKDHLFAVFVSQYNSQEDIKNEISEKIAQISQYHWDKVHVHAMGQQNVTKAKRAVLDIREECDTIIDVKEISDNEHLKITLLLDKDVVPE